MLKRRRICAWPGCGAVTVGKYCARHAAEAEKRRLERRRVLDRKRPRARQRGYDESWREARDAYLREHPICCLCGEPATVVDHIVPHRGDEVQFWNRRNWQPLCASCHSSKTAHEDGGGWRRA